MDLASASVTTPAPSQYVRMSTEHQQYSPENQLRDIIIRQYPAAHNMEIDFGHELVETLPAGDVQPTTAMVGVALDVYDVRRWGKYQDVDDLVCGQRPIAGHSPKRKETSP